MKTTKAHFAIFKEQVEKEIKKWGLLGWRVCIDHKKTESDDCNAEISYYTHHRLANIRLNLEWGEDVSEHQLRRSAFHEVMELLLADHLDLVVDTDLNQAQKRQRLEMVSHQVIRTMEHVVGYEKE